MASDVAVVVPTHNRAPRLKRLIAALEAQTLPPVDVVLVDDGSSDNTAEVVGDLIAGSVLPLRLLRLQPGRGPAGARNADWRATSSSVVAFTDDDCAPERDWLRLGAAAFAGDDQIGIVQGETIPEPGVDRRPWDTTREIREPSPFFEGCNLLVRREALDATGGFSEALFMGFEDTWLGWSVLDAGWQRTFAPDARVAHDVTYPGLMWHIQEAWRMGNVSAVAKRFPAIRREFWQPWSFRSSHAALVCAAAGAVLLPRTRLAGALFVPWFVVNIWGNRTRRPDAQWWKNRAFSTVLDAVGVASIVTKAARHRTVLI